MSPKCSAAGLHNLCTPVATPTGGWAQHRSMRQGILRRLLGSVILLCAAAAVIGSTSRIPMNPAIDRARTIEATHRLPESVSKMLKRACSNCHSNDTNWPWYARLPVASGLIRQDIGAARGTMNFSEWADRVARHPQLEVTLLQAACSDLKQERMPMKRYLMLHPDARVTPAEKNAFCAWVDDETRRVIAAKHSGQEPD